MITNNLKVNTKVNKFVQRSTSLIIKDLKVNIIVNAPKTPNDAERAKGSPQCDPIPPKIAKNHIFMVLIPCVYD